jgi:hypothetical protein
VGYRQPDVAARGAGGQGQLDVFVTRGSSAPRAARRRGVRARRSASAAIAFALAAILVTGCGSAARTGNASASGPSLFGPFAGYNWLGPVHTISAVIVVPSILNGSPTGIAGSWIGAQGPSKKLAAPFIQVGVNEARLAAHGQSARDVYYAFWSDTVLGFHPKVLFQVRPGDEVRLYLALNHGYWAVAARDQTSDAGKSLVTTQEGRASFNGAGWTQEDVSNTRTAAQFPYPDLSPVSFSQLQVNGIRPTAQELETTWMTTSKETLGPTPLTADSFSVMPVRPSAEELRYQQMVLAVDEPGASFNAALASWSTNTPARTIRDASFRFARALQQAIDGLSEYHWSTNITPLIAELVAATRRTRTAVLRLAATPPKRLPEARAAFPLEVGDQHSISLEIKARLHLPVTSLSEAALAKYLSTHSA